MSDYLHIHTGAGGAWLLRQSADRISGLDSIIFDVDGVLIDVGESIQLVHRRVARHYFGLLGWTACEDMVSPEDVDAFKLARGFNSDWDLAYVWTLLYLLKSKRYGSTNGAHVRDSAPTIAEFTGHVATMGGGMDNALRALRDAAEPGHWTEALAQADRPLIEKLFQECYSGHLCPEVYGFEPTIVHEPGLITSDRALMDRESVPEELRLGIATGRTLGETIVGLRVVGLSDLFSRDRIVSEDDRVWKPDPAVLRLAVERIGGSHPAYVGDTPDDLTTVRNYRESGSEMLAVMVLSGLRDPRTKQAFIGQKADVIADNVNAALAAVSECIGGAICLTEQQR